MPAPVDYPALFRKLRADVDALVRRSPLANTGMSATAPGVVTMAGDFVVEGNFIAQGKIENDALVAPVRTDSAFEGESNFALTTTGDVPLATETWTVPEGFTRVNVMVAVRVYAFNPTASLDYLYARPRVTASSSGGSYVGQGVPVAVSGPGGSGLNTSFLSVEVANLTPGSAIILDAQGWTGYAGWAADPLNWAEVSAQLLWTR